MMKQSARWTLTVSSDVEPASDSDNESAERQYGG
jgi:hypothetical protein